MLAQCDRCYKKRSVRIERTTGLAFCFLCQDSFRGLTRYRVCGKVTQMDGTTASLSRVLYSTPRSLEADVRALIAKRKDRGFPWFGDALYATDPNNEKHTILIPWE